VFPNITKERIASTFDKLDLGIVDKIDFVRKNGSKGPYNAVYVHLKYWLSTDASRRFRATLFGSKDGDGAFTGAKLVYENPWFWVVLPNTSQEKSVTDSRPNQKPELKRNAKIYPEAKATVKAQATVKAKAPSNEVPRPVNKHAMVIKANMKSKAKRRLEPRTPPQTPPQTPRSDSVCGAGCNAPKKVMSRRLELEQLGDLGQLGDLVQMGDLGQLGDLGQKMEDLHLRQMEANLFAAEELLSSFAPRPRTNSEEDAMSLEEGEM
jgi:hypothetical protein